MLDVVEAEVAAARATPGSAPARPTRRARARAAAGSAAWAAPPRSARGSSRSSSATFDRGRRGCSDRIRSPAGTRRAPLRAGPSARTRAPCRGARATPPASRAGARSCSWRCRAPPAAPCRYAATASSRLPARIAASPWRNALPGGAPAARRARAATTELTPYLQSASEQSASPHAAIPVPTAGSSAGRARPRTPFQPTLRRSSGSDTAQRRSRLPCRRSARPCRR